MKHVLVSQSNPLRGRVGEDVRGEGEAERESWKNESEGEGIIGLKHFLHLVERITSL